MVIFNPIDYDYIVSWQSDLENTKESIFPVCDKPCYKIKENAVWGGAWKIVELSIWDTAFNQTLKHFTNTLNKYDSQQKSASLPYKCTCSINDHLNAQKDTKY